MGRSGVSALKSRLERLSQQVAAVVGRTVIVAQAWNETEAQAIERSNAGVLLPQDLVIVVRRFCDPSLPILKIES